MHSSKEMRNTALETIKSGNAKMLMIFIAAFLFIPLVTLFMPSITVVLYIAISFFAYPYYKIAYETACGKTIELEDILDYSNFINYIISKVILFIKSLFPLIGIFVSFLLSYVSVINPIWWPIELTESETNIFFYGGIVGMIIFFILLLNIKIKYSISKYYIIDGLKASEALNECKNDIRGNTFKYFLFMFPNYLLILLGCIIFAIPLVIFIPYTLLAEATWYYELRYGDNCSGSYYKKTNDLMTYQEKQQIELLEERNNRNLLLNQNTNQYNNHVSLIDGFSSLEQHNNPNVQPPYMPQPPIWPPQQTNYPNVYYPNNIDAQPFNLQNQISPIPNQVPFYSDMENKNQQEEQIPHKEYTGMGIAPEYYKIMGLDQNDNNIPK